MANEEQKQDAEPRSSEPAADPDEETRSRKEFLQIFKRGAEFSEELMRENERLRFQMAEIESRHANTDADEGLVKELMEKVGRLEGERHGLAKRFAEVEAENQDFANRYLEIETENNNLLNIYVASYQLHSTLEFREVIQIITEIILNFVGAEAFAVGLLAESGGQFKVLAAEGIAESDVCKIRFDSGMIGRVIESGDTELAEKAGDTVDEPAVCVPLKIKEEVIGLLLIYRFLQQKDRLATVDHELFTLLAGHAATAIFSSKLYTDSRRKLNTIQGFIELMSSE